MTELTELIYGAKVYVSTCAFILRWGVESLFTQQQFEKLWKYFAYAFSIERKHFDTFETEFPSLA